MSSDGSIYHFHIKPSLHHMRPWRSSRNVLTVVEAKDVSFCSWQTASQAGGDCQEDEDSQDSLKDFHFSELRWGEVRWVLSERLRLGDTETPPADGDIYRTSRYTWWQSVPSVLCLLIRPASDSYIRHVCTVLIAPGETYYFPHNW